MNAPPVISSKFSAPACSDIIHRKNLLDFLSSSKAPLTWISAPGGSGKTILAADWLNHSKKAHIWLRLDTSDSSVGTFFHHLVQATQHTFPNEKNKLVPFSLANSLDPEAYMRNFFNTLLALIGSSECILVLDDYHELLPDSYVHTLLSQTIERLQKNIHVLVLSRHLAPPSYINLKVNNRLNQLEWEDLKFSSSEVDDLLSKTLTHPLSDETVSALKHETDGWAAGIRLMTSFLSRHALPDLSAIRQSHVANILHKESFDYFAQEVMENIPKDQQMLLLKTSCLPYFTARMADQINSQTNSEVFLESLAKRNLFVEKHFSDEVIYSYHPLFQQYLKKHLANTHSKNEIRQITQFSAHQLAAAGSPEEATELLLAVQAYDGAKQLIKNHATLLVYQGRGPQVENWFNLLPSKNIENDPDLLAIWSNSLLLGSTERACEILRRAIDGYLKQQKLELALQTYGSYLEALAIAGKDYHLLEPCLGQLETIISSDPKALQPSAEKIACIVLFATSFVTLKHPLQERWKVLAEIALTDSIDPVSLLKSCNNMMVYYRFKGDDRHIYHLLEILKPVRLQTAHIPLMKLQTQLIDAFHLGYVCGKGREAADICRMSIQEGIDTGIRLYEFWFRYILVLTLLRDEEFITSDKEIKILLSRYTELPTIRKADVLTLSGISALYKQDLYQAKHDLVLAKDMYHSAGARYPIYWSSIILALTYHELGEHDSYQQLMEGFDTDWLGSGYLAYQAMCVQAWRELTISDSSIKYLKDAFALAHEKDFIFIPLVGKRLFSILCQQALIHSIEPAYVHKIIAEHDLEPDDPAKCPHLWPFPIKIYTLQPFRIVRAKSGIENAIQLQQKPLELLKYIISKGGYNVPIEAICDALWSDSEGDAAYKALKTTLYRLRKCLGGDQFIITNNNMLSLSKNCWVDAFSFWTPPEKQSLQDINSSLQLVGYYQAPFLSEGSCEFWSVTPRERIRSNFKLIIRQLVQKLLEIQRIEDAIFCLEQALSTDATEEDYYRDLMNCYAAQGRSDRIESIYMRCRSTYSALLNKEPSAKLVTHYNKLLKGL